jgi:hypothetical protein
VISRANSAASIAQEVEQACGGARRAKDGAPGSIRERSGGRCGLRQCGRMTCRKGALAN